MARSQKVWLKLSTISKWKAPKEERLKELVKGVNQIKIDYIRLLEQNDNEAEVYCDVSVDNTKQRWSGTIMLENVAGEWKIVKMRLKEVK